MLDMEGPCFRVATTYSILRAGVVDQDESSRVSSSSTSAWRAPRCRGSSTLIRHGIWFSGPFRRPFVDSPQTLDTY